MHGLNEISPDIREYLHSKLIRDTGVIFLELENYKKHGYVRHEASRDSRNIKRSPYFGAPGVLSTLAILGILTIPFLSNRNQKSDSEEHTHVIDEHNPVEFIPLAEIPDNLEEIISSLIPPKTVMPPNKPTAKPSPEEVVYVGSFKAFLDNHLRSNGYIYPRVEELVRNGQMPYAYYTEFTIEKDGTVHQPFLTYPPPDPKIIFGLDIHFYTRLFRALPKFVSPSEAKLPVPYKVHIAIINHLTTDKNRIYWVPHEINY